MIYLDTFWAEVLETFCHIWNQCPRLCLTANFRTRTNMLKFGIKNALFGCFGNAVTSFEKLLRYLKSKLWICRIAKFVTQMKILKFETIDAFFGIFVMEFETTIVILKNSSWDAAVNYFFKKGNFRCLIVIRIGF